jgi:molybdenum cofactor cytidylyltransferase
MGAFKPLLEFGGRTVVESCVDNLLRGGVGEVVVVVGHRAEEVRAALAPLSQRPVRFALNELAGSEMGVSIARGVAQVSTAARAALVALVDQPAVEPETIRRVVAAHEQEGARLVVPEHAGRGGHPVLVDLVFRAELLSLVPERGLRALFERHKAEVRRLPVTSPYVIRDIDTWADYCALYEELFGRKVNGGQ